MRDAAMFWLLSGNRRRARDRRARAWAECERSSPRRSILRCRSIRFLFMPASMSVWDIPATTGRKDICFARPATNTWATLRANCEKQVSMGLKDVRLITGDEIRSMFPQLRGDDLVGGSFCSTDGFVDPYSAMMGFMTCAADHGATLWKNTAVTGIVRDGRGVSGVETTRGSVVTRKVVNCAGAWAAGVPSLAGVKSPVEPLRRMLVPSEPLDEFPHTAPMIIDMSNGFHFRPESRGFLLAWNDPEETPGYKTDFDVAFIEKILTRAADRVPCFADLPVNPKRAWAGLYEMTPDHHPVLGEVPEVPGFFLANGFSGHGVMHAPATGKILSDLILTGKTDLIDASLLNLSRFAEGRTMHETAVL